MYGIKTLAQAEAALADAQFCLVEAASKGTHRLADRVADVEEWRGVVSVFAEWERGLEYLRSELSDDMSGKDRRQRVELEKWKLLTRMALRGADDSWSGRGNDAKRSFHDGRLKALSHLETKLSYDED